jgi:hypothetical protein
VTSVGPFTLNTDRAASGETTNNVRDQVTRTLRELAFAPSTTVKIETFIGLRAASGETTDNVRDQVTRTLRELAFAPSTTVKIETSVGQRPRKLGQNRRK